MGALVEALRFVIGQATTSLSADLKQDLAATGETTSLLRQAVLKKQMASGDGAALRKQIDAATKQRTDAAKALQAYHERVLVKIDEDLGEIQSLLGGGGV